MWHFIKNTLQNPEKKSFKVFHDILAVVILASTLAVIFETVPRFAEQYPLFFHYADIVFVVFFGMEYVLRLVTDEKPLRYIFSFMGLVDIVSFLPSLILMGLPLAIAPAALRSLRIVRTIRILRLLRVVRLVRYFGGRKQGKDRVDRAGELLPFVNIEIYFFALFIIITFSASLMYWAEGNVPGTAFQTIPDGMWWAISTVTTVGYGDIVPVTTAGKIIASFTMISGFALLALLLSVVGPALQTLLFGAKLNTKE